MILGVDIGGTSVKMGLVDEKGRIHAQTEASVCFDGYQTPIIETVCKEAKGFLSAQNAEVSGIGVSATGQIDSHRGVVIGTNGKIPHYEGTPIKERLQNALGVPAWVLNDANAAALGECFIGRARGRKHVIMLTLGTGVGGGLVLNGKLYDGRRGIAGELGHFSLYQDGLPCTCGKRGCFESYASTTALLTRVRKAYPQEAEWTGRLVFERAAQGDQALRIILSAWIDDIAAGISGLVHIFNPEMVIVGGGVSRQEALLMQPLRERVLSGVMPRFAEGLQIESALLGNEAGMIGAVKFFLEQEKECQP